MSGPLLVAIALLGAAGGLLVSRDVLVGRPVGSRAVAVVLGIDTGLVLCIGIAVAAAAGRSWHLLDHAPSPDARPLVDLRGFDGDGNLYALLIVMTGLVTLLATTLFATATRCVLGTQPGDRAVVASVLWLEVGATGYCLVRVLLGARGWPYLLPVAHLPLSAGALLLHQRRHRVIA